jgi:inositol oxygenase
MFDTYRNYPDDPTSSIYQHYYNKNTRQTLSLVESKHHKYINGFFDGNHKHMTMLEALSFLNNYHDPSDPDTDDNNLIHAYQTAERIRKDYPELEWLQITGLIHDVGKILFLAGEPDWCVVGDTFPLGCKYRKECIYSQFFTDNPEQYSDEYIYKEGCGLDKLTMTWGHDEYLYRVLTDNNILLPNIALRIIRYHSFYPLHKFGAYKEFLNSEDCELLPWLHKFSNYDLYSKHDEFTLTDDIVAYYNNLLSKFFPNPLIW